jgi:hypothetical protein
MDNVNSWHNFFQVDKSEEQKRPIRTGGKGLHLTPDNLVNHGAETIGHMITLLSSAFTTGRILTATTVGSRMTTKFATKR